MSQSIVSPENQNVTFIELFFDLVFVFAVTQLVFFLHQDISLETGIQVLIMFWFVMLSWGQFTWALNAANTRHSAIELMVLLTTAIAFFMAISIPNAFTNQAPLFATTYVITRLIGLLLYGLVASEDKEQFQAVKTFALGSAGGLLVVIAGAIIGGELQIYFWASAIFLDLVISSIVGNFEGWNLHPEHFSERYGLFVIIALGETLIVAAGGVTGVELTNELLMVTILSVALTFSFWWSYFDKTKPVLDHVLETKTGQELNIMAKNFSIWHFPLLLGVIS